MARSTGRPKRPELVNIGVVGPSARIETGAAFELVLSTLHVADPDPGGRFAEAAIWRERRRALGTRRLRVLERIGVHPMFNLVGMAADLGSPYAAEDLVARLRRLPPAEIVYQALGMYRRVYRRLASPDLTREAVAGDRAARREFLRRSLPDVPEWQASARFLLSRRGDELGAELRDELVTWHHLVFAAEAARIVADQERCRTELLEERPSWSVDALAARVLPGMDFVPAADVSEIVFVPDTVIRPAVVVADHRSDFVTTFPITIDASEAGEPPDQLVRFGKALGDELRLRALRRLAAGPSTLAELAEDLGVPRTTLSHHMSVLRAAGLVTVVVEEGRWGRLRLREAGIDAAPRLLRAYLAGAQAEERA
jgi:DNA-binding transcriptional ArsR family regulator